MTDLQLSLLALGALIIAGVVLFNWWQERNLRKEAAERFESPQRDVLMDDFRINPDAVLDDDDGEPSVSNRLNYQQESYEQQSLKQGIAESGVAGSGIAEQAAADDEAYPAHPYRSNGAGFDSEIPHEPARFSHADIEDRFTTTQPIYVTEAAETYPSAAREAASSHAETAAIHTETAADASFDALPEGISHQIDVTAVLYLQHPASGAALRGIIPALSGLDKPFYVHGLAADNHWYFLTAEYEATEFVRAAYSLQLADRSGPVSRETLTRFQDAVDSVGHALGAQVEWQGHPDPLNYAVELDQFCIDVDKMVGFHIIQGPSGPFTGTKFRGLAEASGLVLGENGAFIYANENGVLYSLVNQDSIPFTPEMLRTIVLRGISFQLDIPRVKHCAEVFNQMVLAAKQMENSLSALLVDDHQRPLGEVQIEKIRQQLKVIHSQMVARGVVPGSPTALRLFS